MKAGSFFIGILITLTFHFSNATVAQAKDSPIAFESIAETLRLSQAQTEKELEIALRKLDRLVDDLLLVQTSSGKARIARSELTK